MSVTVQDVLERAAQILEHSGWCQQYSHRSSGESCLYGAILDAAPGSAMDAVYEVRERIGVMNTVGLFDWNDAPGRTLSEVLAVLRIPGHCECEMDGDQRRYCASCKAREEAE